jgi:hypothetical protein
MSQQSMLWLVLLVFVIERRQTAPGKVGLVWPLADQGRQATECFQLRAWLVAGALSYAV